MLSILERKQFPLEEIRWGKKKIAEILGREGFQLFLFSKEVAPKATLPQFVLLVMRLLNEMVLHLR